MKDRFVQVSKIDNDFSAFLAAVETCPEMWAPAQVGVKQFSPHRSNYIFSMTDFLDTDPNREHDVSKEFISLISVIDPIIVSYRENFDIPLRFDSGWGLNKYPPGAYYKTHWDWHPDEPRTVSVVVMANTVEEGGSLYFPRQDITIPAEEGTVAIFPSCFAYEHTSTPVKRGIKYSLVTWLG